jgi:8-oxo-dGTP diphosphatase
MRAGDAGAMPIPEALRPRFCPRCGGPVHAGAVRGAFACAACDRRIYLNPVAAVAGVLLSDRPGLPAAGVEVPPERATHLLWVRRAGTEQGCWCLPCGYVEYGEEIRAALAREMAEETGLTVAAGAVLTAESNFHDPLRLTVGIWFLVRYLCGSVRPGDDADRAGFFPLSEGPEPMAFPTDRRVLEILAGPSHGCR